MSSSQRSRKALATFIFSDPKGVTFSIPSVNHGDAPIIGRSKLTTKIQQPDHFRKQLGQEKDSPKPTKLWKKKRRVFGGILGDVNHPKCLIPAAGSFDDFWGLAGSFNPSPVKTRHNSPTWSLTKACSSAWCAVQRSAGSIWKSPTKDCKKQSREASQKTSNVGVERVNIGRRHFFCIRKKRAGWVFQASGGGFMVAVILKKSPTRFEEVT